MFELKIYVCRTGGGYQLWGLSQGIHVLSYYQPTLFVETLFSSCFYKKFSSTIKI